MNKRTSRKFKPIPGSGTPLYLQLARFIADSVRAAPGAVDVGVSTKGQRPELNVQPKRALAGAIGVNLGQLASALRYAFAAVDAGTWVYPSGLSRYVHVRFTPTSRATAADLEQLPIPVAPTTTGNAPMSFVPLSQELSHRCVVATTTR